MGGKGESEEIKSNYYCNNYVFEYSGHGPCCSSVNNGALKYNGGQSSTKVYSEIWDNMTSYRGTVEDNVNYGVIATVKVGSNTYTSQWRVGYAYKDADRVWYANETSHYNYEVITTKYSSTTWGKTY